AGIPCGATCSASFTSGTAVTLTASPAIGSTLSGWSGGGCSGTGTCVVTVSAATTVTATFSLPSFALTVSKAGSGSGTVTSSPAGITCGATCSASFASGTAVILPARPAIGSTLSGWTGGGCSGTGTCTITLSAATTVTATFAPTSAPTLSLAFLGTLRDKVGQGNSAFSADGALDGTFRVTLGAGSGARTVTRLALRQTASGGGVWGTGPATADWALGAAASLDAALLNAGTGTVSFTVADGGVFFVF